MPTKTSSLLRCHAKHPDSDGQTEKVHPGWIAASRILLVGLARLHAVEKAPPE